MNEQAKPTSNERPETILRQYLEGQITLSDLQAMLRGLILIDFSFAPERREIGEISLDESIQIPVKDEHLCHMLRRYLSGNLTELDLSNWAAFIFLTQFYVPDGNTEEERWQAGEGPLWDILQKLVTPDIFGGLNVDTARGYLGLLECSG